MTRKKFVKQLMAMGYGRNAAEDMARQFRVLGKSYEDALAWEKCLQGMRTPITDMVAAWAKALQPAVEAAAEIVRKFAKAVSTIDWEAAGKRAEELAAVATREQEAHREDVLDALRYAAGYQHGGGGRE